MKQTDMVDLIDAKLEKLTGIMESFTDEEFLLFGAFLLNVWATDNSRRAIQALIGFYLSSVVERHRQELEYICGGTRDSTKKKVMQLVKLLKELEHEVVLFERGLQ